MYQDQIREILQDLSDEELHAIVGFSEPDAADYGRFIEQCEKRLRLEAAILLARRARAVRSQATLDSGGLWCVYHDQEFAACPRCGICGEHLAAAGDEHNCVIPS